MNRRLVIAALMAIMLLGLSGCDNQTESEAQPVIALHSSIEEQPTEEQLTEEQPIEEQPTEEQPAKGGQAMSENHLPKAPEDSFVSYWDEFAQSYGGSDVYFSELPMEVDLLPLYISGMQHSEPYVRWACAYKAFEYNLHERKPEIIEALKPLLIDPVQQVQDAARFSTAVLTETFSGPEFVPSPDGENIAFTPYIDSRFNDGKLWIYFGESRQTSMVLELLSIGGDGGVAGYIQWSPDGSKLAVGDGGRLWSDTVILNLSTLTTNKQGLMSYLVENSEELGYRMEGYHRPDPSVRFLEWSPDSKRVLLSYYFAEDQNIWQSGCAIYNSETDEYERIIPNEATDDEYTEIEKPDGFEW